MPLTNTYPSPTHAPGRAAPDSYGADLSRSLGVGGNVLITLSSISPASSVFILGGAALAGYGTGVFWGFAIAGVISISSPSATPSSPRGIRSPAATTRS